MTRDFTHPCELNPSHSGRAEQIVFSCDIVAEYTKNMSCGRKGEQEERGGKGEEEGGGGRREEEGGRRKEGGGRRESEGRRRKEGRGGREEQGGKGKGGGWSIPRVQFPLNTESPHLFIFPSLSPSPFLPTLPPSLPSPYSSFPPSLPLSWQTYITNGVGSLQLDVRHMLACILVWQLGSKQVPALMVADIVWSIRNHLHTSGRKICFLIWI